MGPTIRSLAVLAVAILVVHLVYLGYVLPQAEQIVEAARQAGRSIPQHITVILKDIEQETCIILTIWGIYLILSKCFRILNERYIFSVDLLAADPSQKGDLPSVLAALEALPDRVRTTPLVSTLMSSLRRFLITNDVQNTSDAINSSVESLGLRQETETSMIRYLIWVIPSIGFIGTVRGIGQALTQADQALAGNISGMTESLGVAFNSTLVALIASILLMFLLHQLQRLQDGLIVDTQAYCETLLLNRISKVGRGENAGQA